MRYLLLNRGTAHSDSLLDIMTKYHSKKCYSDDGIKFDSETERDYYYVLRDRRDSGEISNLRLQVPYVIIPKVIEDCVVVKHLKRGDKEIVKPFVAQKETKYFADFVYIDNATGKEIVVDVKSAATIKKESYQLKKKMMLAFKGIKIQEVLWQKRRQPKRARVGRGRSRRVQE